MKLDLFLPLLAAALALAGTAISSAVEPESLDGDIRVVVNSREEVVVFMDVDGEGSGCHTDRVFSFAPADPAELSLDTSAADAHVEHLVDRLTIYSSTDQLLVDVGINAQVGTALWVSYSTGLGFLRYVDEFPLCPGSMDEDLGLWKPGGSGAGACGSCSGGGAGSSSCSVGGCTGTPSSCSVACATGTYSCCKCGADNKASCKCCV